MDDCSPFEGEAPFEEPEMELVKKAAAVGTLLGDGGDSYLQVGGEDVQPCQKQEERSQKRGEASKGLCPTRATEVGRVARRHPGYRGTGTSS